MNVSDFIVRRLATWGVKRVFGYPGDGINGLVGAFNRDDHGVRFIQARHEEMAAFMACGHAKFTGSVGVCLATSGPGAIHLLNGLYDAKMDRAPVVAIVGQSARSALGGDYQQEVDLPTLFKDVAGAYVQTVMTPEAVRHVVDRAFRVAQAERTVTCVILPKDVQELPAMEPARAHDTVHTGTATSTPPFVMGAIGLLGTKASWNLFAECDTFLMIGSSFPYSEFLPKEGQARGIQIDIDPRRIGIRYPMEANLVGDARPTLQKLLPRVHPKADRAWQDRVTEWTREWRELVRERAMLPAAPINPQRVFLELSSRLPDGAILTCDSGSAANWFARNLVVRAGMMASLSGSLATMGCGVPYAIAAKFAYPNRPVIALVGDGAMQMNGNAELLTIAKYRREWPDPRLVVLVLHNNDLNMVTWEMRATAGDPAYRASQELPNFAYADYAELVGLRGIRVEKPEALGEAWERALSADRPVVLDVLTDPDVAPLPPHITLAQAKSFGLALAKGDPHEEGIIKRAIGQIFPKLGI